jgi:hypothetical protein
MELDVVAFGVSATFAYVALVVRAFRSAWSAHDVSDLPERRSGPRDGYPTWLSRGRERVCPSCGAPVVFAGNTAPPGCPLCRNDFREPRAEVEGAGVTRANNAIEYRRTQAAGSSATVAGSFVGDFDSEYPYSGFSPYSN